MKITPHNNNVLLERIEQDTGGILTPESYENGACSYRVVAISKDIDEKLYTFKVGDEVFADVSHSYPIHQVLKTEEKYTLVGYMQVRCSVEREEGDEESPSPIISDVSSFNIT